MCDIRYIFRGNGIIITPQSPIFVTKIARILSVDEVNRLIRGIRGYRLNWDKLIAQVNYRYCVELYGVGIS